MGDGFLRVRLGQGAVPFEGDAFPRFPGASLFRLHVFRGLPGQLGGVQAHGACSLRGARLPGCDPSGARGCQGGRLDPPKLVLLRLCRRPAHDKRPLCVAVRRSTPGAGDHDHEAGDGPCGQHSGRHGRDRPAHGPPRASRDEAVESLLGRRRGAELRGQRTDPERGALRAAVDSAGGRGCRRSAGRGPFRLAPLLRCGPRGGRGVGQAVRVVSRSLLFQRGHPRVSGSQRVPLSPGRTRRAGQSNRRSHRSGQDCRVPGRANGVRPARAGSPEHSGRSTKRHHAEHHEPEDQIPRILPSLCPVRLGGPLCRLLRRRRPESLHAPRGARAESAPAATARRADGHLRSAESPAQRYPGRDAPGLFGPSADGEPGHETGLL